MFLIFLKNNISPLIKLLFLLLLLGCQKHMGYTDCRYVNGYCSGSSPLTIPSHTYVGEYLNGKKHGYGTYTWPNGDKYVGDFKYDRMNGRATWYFNYGSVYSGTILNDRFHGTGKVTYSDRTDWSANPDCENVVAYEGEFLHGNFDKGTFTYKDGSTLSGVFKSCTLISNNNSKNNKEKTNKINKEVMPTNMDKAKKECVSLGFKEKTEKFGECVMELIK